MQDHVVPEVGMPQIIGAVVIAMLYIGIFSLVKKENRTRLNAIVLAGAGAAYLSSGLGPWEFAFCALMTFVAYKGLTRNYMIGIGWILHTCWDLVHHLKADAIVPMDPTSSFGCAICDPILALWFFSGAPNVWVVMREKLQNRRTLKPIS
ncbi:DUF6010 family protein [Chitinophaga arvensicola]|uniref:Integral membrane protein n=1 Tax=Chitinophaga arvensicola TaxID=29529 RepID=A0A1I0S539_9BACT|nr:DUF6010 family protein [Chitinophaga arvensicola]SEW49811.1 hypothetical protein SAMN04488122_3588 [Chitinophaga arvensicola]